MSMKRFDVKKLRQRLGETQEQFSERFPVNVRSVKRWERGLPVSPMAMSRIRDILDELRTAKAAEAAEAGSAGSRSSVPRRHQSPSASPMAMAEAEG